MFKNFVKFSFLTVLLAFIFFLGIEVTQAVDLKQQVGGQLQAGVSTSGLGTPKDPRVVAATIVQFGLTLVGTIFLIMIAMSSFWYITARGQEQRIEKATSTLRGAVIGLIIVVMAYSITYFVSKNIQRSVGITTSANTVVLVKSA